MTSDSAFCLVEVDLAIIRETTVFNCYTNDECFAFQSISGCRRQLSWPCTHEDLKNGKTYCWRELS